MAFPMAPPISGSFPTPKIIRTTTRTIINSIGPNLNGIVSSPQFLINIVILAGCVLSHLILTNKILVGVILRFPDICIEY